MKEATPTFVEVSAESIRDLNDSELRSLWLSFVDASDAGAPYPEGLEKQEFDSRMEIVRQAMKTRNLQEQAPSAKTQTFILSKERFDTIEKARQWMTDNDQPIDKVDETETSFRFRQFDPEKCTIGSFRIINISDGVQAGICRQEESEGSSEHQNKEAGHAPTSELGFDVMQSFEKINELGRKWTPEEAGFQQKSPSADVTCGACRFYLRHPTEAIGACQVVDGPIPWNATSKAYISAADEAEFAFSQEVARESIDYLQEGVRRLFGSPGGKGRQLQLIIPLIPPHKKFVETFAGSAAVFFAKENADKSVLNDKDPWVYHALKTLKEITDREITTMKSFKLTGDESYFRSIREKAPSGKLSMLHWFLYCRHFSVMSKEPHERSGFSEGSGTLGNKIESIHKVREHMKNTTVSNQDAVSIIRTHDGPDTFFFIDPPYSQNKSEAKGLAQGQIDMKRLVAGVRGLKGKFLLTVWESKENRNLFKEFNLRSVDVPKMGGDLSVLSVSVDSRMFLT